MAVRRPFVFVVGCAVVVVLVVVVVVVGDDGVDVLLGMMVLLASMPVLVLL
jgi:hypothetical protein